MKTLTCLLASLRGTINSPQIRSILLLCIPISLTGILTISCKRRDVPNVSQAPSEPIQAPASVSASTDASKHPAGMLSQHERHAIIYLADQLAKNPLLQAYVIRRETRKSDGQNEFIVLYNTASQRIYQTINSPEFAEQLMEQSRNKNQDGSFEVDLEWAPGNYLELTDAGKTAFGQSLIEAGISDGYRDDIVYLLNDQYDLRGRERIISIAKQIKSTINFPISKLADQSSTGKDHAPSVYSLPPQYATMLATVVKMVEKERPNLDSASDLFGLGFDSSFRMCGEPVLLLSIDLIKMEDGKVVSMMGSLGMKSVSEYLSHPDTFLGGKIDAFTMLCNFPVFPNQAQPVFDLAKNSPNVSVRCASIMALRNSQFIDEAVIPYLSSLLNDSNKDIQYAALLALASSPSFGRPDVILKPYQIPTDEVLSNIERLLTKEFQARFAIPIVGILSRAPYVSDSRVPAIAAGLKITLGIKTQHLNPEHGVKSYYDECLRIIGDVRTK